MTEKVMKSSSHDVSSGASVVQQASQNTEDQSALRAVFTRHAASKEQDLSLTFAPHVRRASITQRLFAALCACALFIGLGATCLVMFGLNPLSFEALVGVLVGVVIIAGCVALFERGRAEMLGYALLACVVILVILLFKDQFIGGAALVLNSFSVVIGQRSATYPVPYVVTDTASLTLFLSVCAAFLSVICATVALRGNIVLCTVFALFCAACVVVGFSGFTPWLVLIALGVLGCFAMNLAVLNHITSSRAFILSLVAAIVGALLVGGVFFGISRVTEGGASAFRSALVETMGNLIYGSKTYALPAGQLDDLGPHRPSDALALVVTAPQADTSIIYLRGFVGEQYANDTWSALPAEAVTENGGLFYWLEEDGFSPLSQLAQAADIIDFSEVTSEEMTISYEGVRPGYAYLPYTYAFGAAVTPTTDEAQAAPQSAKTSFTISMPVLTKAYRLQEALIDAQTEKNEQLNTYLADEEAYRTFVYENYRSIPESCATIFAELIGTPRQLEPDEAKMTTSSLLDALVSYSDDVGASDDGTDLMTYFLLESGEGYSVQYATAATLLMRYYGVPARYVEGYQLNAKTDEASSEDNQEEMSETALAADANEASTEPVATTVELTEKNAHAWVEYYLDGVGWVVYDPTPGYATSSFYELTDNATESKLGELYNQGSDGQSTWEPLVVEEDTSEESESPDEQSDANSPYRALWLIIGIIVGLILAWWVRGILVRRRLKHMRVRFEQGDARTQIPEIFSYGLMLAQMAFKVRLANKPYPAQSKTMEEAKVCSAETFLRAALANERALFSQVRELELDRTYALVFIDEVRDAIRQNAGFFRRHMLSGVWGVVYLGRKPMTNKDEETPPEKAGATK